MFVSDLMTNPEFPAENKIRVPMTSKRVMATIRDLNRVIAGAESQRSTLGVSELQWLLALRERRYTLRLLLVARRIESNKKIVSLDKWRNGFKQPLRNEAPQGELTRWVEAGQGGAG